MTAELRIAEPAPHLHAVPPQAPGTDIEDIVADNLSRLRALRHLSLDGLARKSGVSRAMLAQIESGPQRADHPRIAARGVGLAGVGIGLPAQLRAARTCRIAGAGFAAHGQRQRALFQPQPVSGRRAPFRIP
jgi:DNA-binding XRE family transcriptional regulator